MIRREQVHARVLEMIAAAAVGRHSRQPGPTLDVDTSETHVLHEGKTE